MVSGPREREDQSKNITKVDVEPKPNMVSGPKQRKDQSRVGIEPKPVDLPSKVPPVIDPNLKTPVVRSKPVLDLGSSELTSPFLAPDPAPAQRARTPKIDPTTGLTYNLVFDWPSNWADREGRLPNEAIYPYDISEINLHSKSAMVGQIGPIGKDVQCSENAKYGNDNFNTEFSLCMNGLTVLGWVFGPRAFCQEMRKLFIEKKGTYLIFEHYKALAAVPTFLPINHDVEIVVTKRTVLTPVTVQREFKDFKPRPTDPEKAKFAREFAQGHKTPASIRETARKAKQREPNAKKKLLLLDGQKKIFEFTKQPDQIVVPHATPKSIQASPATGGVLRSGGQPRSKPGSVVKLSETPSIGSEPASGQLSVKRTVTPSRPQTSVPAFSPSELESYSAIYTKSSKIPPPSYAPAPSPPVLSNSKGNIGVSQSTPFSTTILSSPFSTMLPSLSVVSSATSMRSPGSSVSFLSETQSSCVDGRSPGSPEEGIYKTPP